MSQHIPKWFQTMSNSFNQRFTTVSNNSKQVSTTLNIFPTQHKAVSNDFKPISKQVCTQPQNDSTSVNIDKLISECETILVFYVNLDIVGVGKFGDTTFL